MASHHHVSSRCHLALALVRSRPRPHVTSPSPDVGPRPRSPCHGSESVVPHSLPMSALVRARSPAVSPRSHHHPPSSSRWHRTSSHMQCTRVPCSSHRLVFPFPLVSTRTRAVKILTRSRPRPRIPLSSPRQCCRPTLSMSSRFSCLALSSTGSGRASGPVPDLVRPVPAARSNRVHEVRDLENFAGFFEFFSAHSRGGICAERAGSTAAGRCESRCGHAWRSAFAHGTWDSPYSGNG